MTEVSSWSPTDASNNLTPPDGWPEGMQPSGVNDVGRMMMGAIRRWYNTVSAGIANALPLSGGTLTGGLTAPNLISTAGISAAGSISTPGDIFARNLTTSADIHCLSIAASGNAFVAYLSSAGDIHATGSVIADSDVRATGLITAGTSISAGTSITAGTSVSAPYLASSGNIDASGTITANVQLHSNGSLVVEHDASISGTLHVIGISTLAATFASTLTASSSINTITYQIQGTTFASSGSDGNGAFTYIADTGAAAAIVMYGANGSFYRCDNAHWFTNRGATFNVACLATSGANAGKTFNASGVWDVFSDASLKAEDSVAPYTAGLAAALKLNPCSFRYASNAPFGVDGETYYGLVAQEVEPVLPEMVGRMAAADGEKFATVAPGHLVFVLLNAVKELEARLAQLENRGG